MLTDEEQRRIDRIRDRDATAFAELVVQYEQTMLRTAERIVGQHSDALEVRQTVLLRIWQQPEKLADARSIRFLSSTRLVGHRIHRQPAFVLS